MRCVLVCLLAGCVAASSSEDPSTVDRAWSLLKDGVADKSATKRAHAVHALGLARTKLTQEMAERALSDEDKEVRAEAATALGLMDAVSARPKLRACLKDPEVQVVLACTNTLYQMKDPAAYDIYYAILTGKRKGHEGLVASQLDTLKDRKQLEKLAFETGIGFVPFGGSAWQAIKTVAHDDSSPIRALAARRLALDRSPETTKVLEEYAYDKKTVVREAVVEAIAERGDPAMISSLSPLMYDSDDDVRYEAAATVVQLSGQRRRWRR